MMSGVANRREKEKKEGFAERICFRAFLVNKIDGKGRSRKKLLKIL